MDRPCCSMTNVGATLIAERARRIPTRALDGACVDAPGGRC